MARNILEGYFHRHNTDGTQESVCRRCRQTVAHEKSEAKLLLREQSHTCGRIRLAFWSATVSGLAERTDSAWSITDLGIFD